MNRGVKLLPFFALIVALLFLAQLPAAHVEEFFSPPCDSFGDVNADGVVNTNDALLINRYVAGLDSLTNEQKIRGDVDVNGQVDSVDALLVLRYVAGLSETFPACSIPPNVPALPLGPISGEINTSYQYTTSSVDPDGDQVKYVFDFGDGTTDTTVFVTSGTVAGVSHSWAAAGTYAVKAKACDSRSACSNWSGAVNVSIQAPAPPPPACHSLQFYSGSISPPTIGAGGTYNLSCNYGQSDVQCVYPSVPGDGCTFSGWVGNEARFSCTAPLTPGKYDISCYIGAGTESNCCGGKNDYVGTLTVFKNYPPMVPWTPQGPTSGETNNSYSYSTWAYDPDEGLIKYIFDWGDGTTSETPLVQGSTDPGVAEPKGSSSHAWGAAGNYGVKARACDDNGACSNWSGAVNVSIQAPAPPPPAGCPDKFTPGEGYGYDPGKYISSDDQWYVRNQIYGSNLSKEEKDAFWFNVIPCESCWQPAAEGQGTNCLAVGLYQLEGDDSRCSENHYKHHWKCETPHAIDVLVNRGSRYWQSWNGCRHCSSPDPY